VEARYMYFKTMPQYHIIIEETLVNTSGIHLGKVYVYSAVA